MDRMDKLSLLLNAKSGTEFFVLFYNFLKKGGVDHSLEMQSAEYHGEFALKLIRTEVLVHTEDSSDVFGAEVTHIFTLTQSGTLIWEITGEEKPIIGLANIQTRLRDMQEQYANGEQPRSARHSPQSQVSEHRTIPLQL